MFWRRCAIPVAPTRMGPSFSSSQSLPIGKGAASVERLPAKARVPGVETFYRGLGFTSVDSFQLFGEPWTVYARAPSGGDRA